MLSRMQPRRAQRGLALILVLLVLFVLSSLAAAILFSVQTQSWTSHNYRLATQGRFLADTAAQRAVAWFATTYRPAQAAYTTSLDGVLLNGTPVRLSAIDGLAANYPDPAMEDAFFAALHNQPVAAAGFQGYWAAAARLLNWQSVAMPFGLASQSLETWQIQAQGHINSPQGESTVQETVLLSQFLQPLLSFAAFATSSSCGAISLLGGAYTDSFDSSRGSYAQTRAANSGNLGSLGNVSVGDQSTVNGSVSVANPVVGPCPDGVTLGAQAAITGRQADGTLAPVLPLKILPTMPPVPTVNPANGSLVVNKNTQIAPGAYGDIRVQGTAQLTFQPGIYQINSLSVSGNASIAIGSSAGGSGAVILYVAGNNQSTPISLTGNSLTNTTGIPSNFQILYGGTGTIQVAGGSAAFGVVYAPNANVQMMGGSDWYGAIISATFTEKGNPTALHYDRSLISQFLVPGPFEVIGISRSTF